MCMLHSTHGTVSPSTPGANLCSAAQDAQQLGSRAHGACSGASMPSQRWRCVCADDIEAALPPAKEVAELPSPQEPRRPTMDNLSSTDDEADEAPAMPLQSVLVQVPVVTFIHLSIDSPVSTDLSRT